MSILWYDVPGGGSKPHVMPVLPGGDLIFSQQTAEAFAQQTMDLGNDQVGHAVFVVVYQSYGESIIGYDPGVITPIPNSGILYFKAGFDLYMMAVIRVIDNIPTITIANGFGRISETGIRQIAPGINGETFTATGIDTGPGGIICVRTYAVIGNERLPGYYFVWGFDYRYIGDNNNYFFPVSGVFVTDNMVSDAQTDPQGGIPIQPEGGNGRYTIDGQTLDFGTAEARSDAMGGGGLASGTGHGTHLYDLDLAALTDFMATVYAGTDDLTFSDFWQAFKNSQHDPLSGILGALIIPHAPPSQSISYMRLSGQSIAVSGNCAYVTKRMGETAAAEIAVRPVYDTFLDFEPFTKISLYLPFVGMVGINTNECMGGKISVKYWIDYCTGNCVAYVTLTDRFGYPSYYQYSGNCAAFVPISGNDAGISSIISGASSVISGTVSALSGNPAGVGSILAGGAVMAEPKTTQKHVGSFSGGAGCIGCLYPFIVVNAPSAATDAGYTNIMGTISALNGRVGDYGGFTAFLQVDTSGVPATQGELQEISAALSEGVYI